MTPKEMLDFVQHSILSDPRYSVFVSKVMAEQVVVYRKEIDSLLAASPAPAPAPVMHDTLLMAVQDSLLETIDSSFVVKGTERFTMVLVDISPRIPGRDFGAKTPLRP